MSIDRRVARTRTALFDALVTLIRQKDYEAITIEEILRQANVGRSTFYAHFRSKDELLQKSLDRLKQQLLAARADQAWAPSRALFEHIAEHADLQLKMAASRGGRIVTEALGEILADLLKEWIPARNSAGISRGLAIRFVVSSLDVTIKWWLEHWPRITAAEADETFRSLVSGGLPPEVIGPFCRVPAAPKREL